MENLPSAESVVSICDLVRALHFKKVLDSFAQKLVREKQLTLLLCVYGRSMNTGNIYQAL